ncbi:hypothetical protein I656_03880 [Geobacillus sp. WSUCF1]|nr:hypothetical protein I656_03880 [Geobacillus sp. WSUCF1]
MFAFPAHVLCSVPNKSRSYAHLLRLSHSTSRGRRLSPSCLN